MLKKIFHPDHLIVTTISLLLIGVLVFFAFNLSFLNPVARAIRGFTMSSIYYKVMNATGEKQQSDLITLVDMTELHKRGDIADLIADIYSMEPRRIGVDIIFEGEKDDVEGDEKLAYYADDCSDKLVTAFKLLNYNGHEFTGSVHSFFTQFLNVTEGFTNAMTDEARSIRSYNVSYNYKGEQKFSLPAQIAMAEGFDVKGKKNQHTINFKAVDFPVVSWKDIGKHPELIKDRIVLVGTTKEEGDMHYTPIGKMSGLHVLAYATLSMMEGYEVSEAGFWLVLLIAFIAGCVTNVVDTVFKTLARNRRSTLMLFIMSSGLYVKFIYFTLMVLLTWGSFALYTRGHFNIDTILALSTIVFIGEGRLLYRGILTVLKRYNISIWKKSLYAQEI